MIEMVLVYCMITDAGKCLEQRPLFENPLTPIACMMSAQRVASDYVREHPDWHLAGWRCEMDKPHAAPA